MFVDYYALLEIEISASAEEVKSAFKKQALKWHPDKNQSIDTTKRMQQINEAYLILKDFEARARYDVEYNNYLNFHRYKKSYQKNDFEDSSYAVNDDILRKWMDNARQQAVNLAKQTIEDLKGMLKDGTKAAAKEAGNQFVAQLTISIIALIIFSLIGFCSHN